MASVAAQPAGTVRWGVRVPLDAPGVYVIAMAASPDEMVTSPACPVSLAALDELLDARAELRVDGVRPTRDILADRLSALWLPDETVVYVGLASASVATRMTQFYKTALGARTPHAGGWPLKTLANLDQLWVHFAPVERPDEAEHDMLEQFSDEVSEATRNTLRDGDLRLPFANLVLPGGARKKHGITGATAPRHATGPSSAHAPTGKPRATKSSPTQQVTAADVAAGRIRIPAATKPLLPPNRQVVSVVLRGREVDARWDPRNGPDRPRSGVLTVGAQALAATVVPDERLGVSVRSDGMIELA